MIVCPVCEHAQESGADCEVCGRRLVAGPAGDLAVAPIEGLDQTRAAPVDVDAPSIPDLEPTGHEPVEAFPEPGVEIEPTHAAPVDVTGEDFPDVERTPQAGLPDDGPTLLPMDVVCRYCREPAAEGERVCGRCGMRLPVYEVALEPMVDGERGEEGGLAPCPSCGVPSRPPRCATCGGRLSSGAA